MAQAMNEFLVSGLQVVPGGQGFPFVAEPVRAGFRHPSGCFRDGFGGKPDAIRNQVEALRVIPATASVMIEQAAGDAGVAYLSRIHILEFQQASFPASVTQRLPF